MQDKNLLIIAHSYKSFVKDSVDICSRYFREINICVGHNPFAEVSNVLPINYLKPFTQKNLIDLTHKPENVNVILAKIIYLPTRKGYLGLGEKYFKVVSRLFQRDNLRKFDLVHSHFVWSAGYVGALMKEKNGIPFIVTAHGYDIYDLPFRDEEWKEKIEYVLNTADYIITVSNSNQKCINKLDVKTPVKVIPNGFNSNLFYPRDSKECRKILKLPLDKKIILTVGNLLEVKGQKYLIEAMREVINHKKEIFCVIVGNGELKNRLEKQVRKSELDDYIKFAGGKLHYEIPIWMNACDVFVLPSLNEGNPTVMFECLGCGKPFVGTKVGGVPEIIISEDYGLLAEPANSKNLAEKILKALDKEWDHEKISKYAEKFTWENIAKEILTIYQRVI
ncbi:Putative teichuronic acid biosynthesis glycosyltransferase TuaC [Methanosarcinales archaeon]|nr:Putative teichuronic acid biosynthesis glycosyltransferase TuaC [Methanosarcinales archaeon]